MAPYAVIRPVALSPRPRLALAALICAAGMMAPLGLRAARAGECVAGPSPSGAAGTSALYGELASSVSAEPLSVDISAQAIAGSCVWVYQVKVLTVSGNVALLDFDLVDLGLKRVEGPADDPDIAKLYERLGGDAVAREDSGDALANGEPTGGAPGGSGSSGSGDSSGSESSGEGSDSSGEGSSGSSGSGGGSSGSGSGSGGEGGDGGDGGDGGEGGD